MSVVPRGVRTPRRLTLPSLPTLLNRLNVVQFHGQSNALGYSATPVLHGLPINAAQAFCFNLGVRTRPAADNFVPLDPATLTSIVPLYERAFPLPNSESVDNVGATEVGETMASTCLDYLAQEFAGSKWFAAAHGKGGRGIEFMDKGTQPYNNGLIGSQKIKELSSVLRPVLKLMVWHQGESNRYQTKDFYRARLEALVTDYFKDHAGVFQETADPWCLTALDSSFTIAIGTGTAHFDPSNQAKLEMHAAHSRFRVVTPCYIFPHAVNPPLDIAHFTALGNARLGEWMGYVYAKLLRGEGWECVRPISTDRNLGNIDVVFAGVEGTLVEDTALVSDTPGKGFTWMVADQNGPTDPNPATPFATANVIAPNTIRLTGAPTAGNYRLRYGYQAQNGAPPGPETGGRGNFRTSVGPASIYGYDPLYKWVCNFDLLIT